MYNPGDLVRVFINPPQGGLHIKVGVIKSQDDDCYWVTYDKVTLRHRPEDLEIMTAKDVARWKERTGQTGSIVR